MVYPACSIRNRLGSSRELLPGHDLETGQLHFDNLFERGMRCASGLGPGFGADQKPIANSANSGPNQFCGELAESVCALDFPQEQEITQERKLAPRAAEDRSRPLPRNPGSADSRALSRRHRLRNLGRKIPERNAALPGGQWLAKQISPRFTGLDQDGTGP